MSRHRKGQGRAMRLSAIVARRALLASHRSELDDVAGLAHLVHAAIVNVDDLVDEACRIQSVDPVAWLVLLELDRPHTPCLRSIPSNIVIVLDGCVDVIAHQDCVVISDLGRDVVAAFAGVEVEMMEVRSS